MVLAGLMPDVVIDICGRALSFWNYQVNLFYNIKTDIFLNISYIFYFIFYIFREFKIISAG
jgi:hypothetical protein